MEFLEKLSLAGLVPVIAVNDADDAVPLCKALSDGGGNHFPHGGCGGSHPPRA